MTKREIFKGVSFILLCVAVFVVVHIYNDFIMSHIKIVVGIVVCVIFLLMAFLSFSLMLLMMMRRK